MTLSQILGYVTQAIEAYTAFEAGTPYTFNVPALTFVVSGVTVELGPLTIPIKKGT